MKEDKKEEEGQEGKPSTHIFVPMYPPEKLSPSALDLIEIVRKDIGMLVGDLRVAQAQAQSIPAPTPLLLNAVAMSVFFHLVTEHCDKVGELTAYALGNYINIVSYALMHASEDIQGVVLRKEELQ